MTVYHHAQVNVARMLASLEDAFMAVGFTRSLAEKVKQHL